jgi:hypothetical protein
MSVGTWTRRTLVLFGVVACNLAACPAWAVQPEQSYLGLAFGASEFSQMSELTAAWPDTSLDTVEESDLAWKLYTGHQFSNWLAVETGWVDFGAARASALHAGGDSVSMKIATSGFEFSALATASIGDSWQVFARGGALAWRSSQKINVGDSLAAEDFSGPDKSGFAAALGLGVHWDLGERNSLRVEWQKYLDVAGGDPETWLLSLARRY